MLRQVHILKKDEIIYQRIFGNALSKEEVEDLYFRIKQDAMKKLGQSSGYYDYFKYRIAYYVELDYDLIFILVTGLMDDFFRLTQSQLVNLKGKVIDLYGEEIKKTKIPDEFSKLDEYVDNLHKNLKPKIAVVGFSGVGKTTIKNLIKKNKIPMQHIPTISGDIATIEIGKLQFKLFDFAGQEQFKYLWKGFIKGSNAVLIITDSTPENVEKSRYFIELIKEEASYALRAVIGNKQDLRDAMDVNDIENIIGLRTYPMIANRAENRDKMIKIIAEVLEMNLEETPLLKDLKISFDEKEEQKKKMNVEESKTEKPSSSKGLEKVKSAKVEAIQNEEKKIIGQTRDLKNGKLINMDISLDLCELLAKEVRGVKIDNTLRNHYKMISATLKSLNNNKQYSYDDFYRDYNAYLKKDFKCSNIALKQFLEPQFSLLKKSIDQDEIISTTLREDDSVVVHSLICAYLSTVNSEKFPDFDEFKRIFTKNEFKKQMINEISLYYYRILNKFEN
ncbi:MAG: GTP-binding protein [Candidatus Lokiarchaeota archaeon]|nr:GTP-binding protein [Candidatus Lokiarchaeota archaeon]MBD3338936.1 GTP-binding protein [Candidatus Lokiarchaeota archaeon]